MSCVLRRKGHVGSPKTVRASLSWLALVVLTVGSIDLK